MKAGSKKHFLNARTNIPLFNDVEGRRIMVAMENTVSYDGDHFEILFLTFFKVTISKRGYLLNKYFWTGNVGFFLLYFIWNPFQDFIKNIPDSIFNQFAYVVDHLLFLKLFLIISALLYDSYSMVHGSKIDSYPLPGVKALDPIWEIFDCL